MNNEPNISLYDADSAEDFPVLKAFQQYIDAEQAKARRRLMAISAFFVVVLIAVIGIFSVMVIKANEQTQTLNDRMVELLLKDKDRSIEEAKTAVVQELTVKNLNATLEKLQKRLDSQELKSARTIAAVREEESAKAAAAREESDKRQEAANAKIQKALAMLKAEKAKLAEEKERLRQEELERYRREHYPEYYSKQNAKKSVSKVLTYDDLEAEEETTDINLDEDEGIEYFNEEEDNFTIPVEVKGKRAGWRVPLD